MLLKYLSDKRTIISFQPKKTKLTRQKSDSGKAVGVPMTRRSRLLKGSQLVNPKTFYGSTKTPIKYPICLLCPRGYYTGMVTRGLRVFALLTLGCDPYL